MVTLRRLAGVIGPLGLLTGVMGLLNNRKKRAAPMSHPMVIEAITILKTHPSALMILGEPISVQEMDLTRPDLNHFGENDGYFQVNALGPKGRGILKTRVVRLDETQIPPWRITRAELKVLYTSELQREEYENKLLLLHDNESTNIVE